jgi:hypothetical protein
VANKISTIIDFDTSASKTKLSSLKQSIDDAEGAGGKLKAGFAGVKDSIINNAGTLAAGAGGALIAFGVKAVGAFTETAKASIDLSKATGLSTEAASRWIGVGDDFQVTAEDLTSSIGKIGKTLDGASWEKYGIATRDAGGHARATNDILVDALAKLSGITNATERAKAGNELFGKGYAKLAPLIGHTKDEYNKMLGAVEKGQVVTEEEAKKAEKMRLAEDQLGDAVHEFTLAVGGMVAQAAPAVTALAQMVTKTLELKDALDSVNIGGNSLLGDTSDSLGVFGKIAAAAGDLKDRFGEMIKYGPFSTTEQQKQQDWADHIKNLVVPSIDDLDRAHKNLAKGGMSDVEWQEKQNAIAADKYAQQVDKTSRSVQSDIDAMQHKWDELTGNLDREKSWLNIQQQVNDLRDAIAEAGTVAKEKGPGSPEAQKATSDAHLKMIDLQQSVIDYAKNVEDLPPEKVTELLAQIDHGQFDATLQEMDRLFLNHTFRINAHLDEIKIDGETHAAGATTISVNGHSGVIRSAEGGVFPARPGGYLANIAEGGRDEAVVPLNSDGSIPGTGGGGNTYNVTVNAGMGATDGYKLGQMFVAAVAAYEDRSGTDWRRPPR